MRFVSWMKADPDRLAAAIGAIALFAMLAALIWISHGAGLATGGDQLLEVVK